LTSATPEPITKGARREALLSEAARQLNARGVSQTSLSDIADKLNISRAAIYHYVEDRQDLIFQCYRRSCEQLAKYLARAARESTTELDTLTGFVAMAVGVDGVEFAALSEIGSLGVEQRDTILGLYGGIVAHLAGVVDLGVRRGLLRPCESHVVAHAILSIVFWIPVSARWSIAVATAPRTAVVQTLVDMIVRGISANHAGVLHIPHLDLSPLLPHGAGVFDRALLTRTRRDALLNAAAHLFNQKGVDATSLDEIAAAARATKRAILHHFGDKATLVGDCYLRAYEVFIHIAAQAHNHGGRRDEALAGAWYALCDADLREDLCPLTPLVGFEGLGSAVQDEINTLSATLAGLYLTILAAGRAEGSVSVFDDNAFLFVVSGAFSWLTKEVVAIDEAQRADICREVTEFVMLGLGRPVLSDER
jgi:AcrR family transcriptional regulator